MTSKQFADSVINNVHYPLQDKREYIDFLFIVLTRCYCYNEVFDIVKIFIILGNVQRFIIRSLIPWTSVIKIQCVIYNEQIAANIISLLTTYRESDQKRNSKKIKKWMV
ncbi:Membrane-associated phosphatidylinositol transfer protein [Dirofilaria immitis]